MVTQVGTLQARGVGLDLVEVCGQCYVHVFALPAPAPPWDRPAYGILIAVPPAAGAGLDGFYLELPYQYQNGLHPRVNGQTIAHGGRTWKQVSWHYPDGRPWTYGADTLETHVEHCKGFFLHRGATNAIT